jgi:hypothetical protein
MDLPLLRTAALLLAAAAGLGACAYHDGYGYGYGYGYGHVAVGYNSGGYCDPYYDDCYYGPGYGHAGYYDPWYGWYGNYYYPGIGVYVYDHGGRRYRWNDSHRSYWEGRRQHWGNRDWNDRRWENWGGYRGGRGWNGNGNGGGHGHRRGH